jgi:SAM-dependent methyltransferase
MVCASASCGARFPVVDGVPVLLDERTSVFDVARVTAGDPSRGARRPSRARRIVRAVAPSISANPLAARNYATFARLLEERSPSARVLVIGAGTRGRGIEALARHGSLELVESDIALGPNIVLVCDGHTLPFADGAFDGVVVQAVLEHVVDPQRCVAEIHRVLAHDGLVYAETPFMQQVHGGSHDFTRFTHLGHRRLFRDFQELHSGAACGPGMALAWSVRYFLLGWVTSRFARGVVKAVSALATFWLKYIDYLLIAKPGALDGAAGVYFLGRKSAEPLSDRALLALYRGAIRTSPY